MTANKVISGLLCLGMLLMAAQDRTRAATLNPAPTAADWAAIGKLPDWSGVWQPDLGHTGVDTSITRPKWTPAAAALVAKLQALDRSGKPENIYTTCLPEGMPGFVMMTLNAMEFLFTPGRVTVLGELDGNRLRRIYTDGRQHPSDPDLTFNGNSIGHWEGKTLVVDTVGFLPEVYIPVGQPVGIPNNGDMHLIEHISLVAPDALQDEIEIIAPHVLQQPWRVMRFFHRTRDRAFDIVEGSCRQGDFYESKDADGNAVFVPFSHDAGGDPLN